MKKYKDHINNAVYFLGGTFLVLLIFAFWGGKDQLPAAQVQAIANSFIILALMLTILQIRHSRKELKANHIWNRRHFAMQEISRIRKETKAARDRLTDLTREPHQVFERRLIEKHSPVCTSKCPLIKEDSMVQQQNFSNRYFKRTPLTKEEVHFWVCEYKKEGEKVFKVPTTEGENDCKMSKQGERIKADLAELINIHEELGVAVKNNTIDEEIAKELYRAPLISNYIFFSQYIEHLEKDHNMKRVGKAFKWLYERWREDKNDENQSPPPEDLA